MTLTAITVEGGLFAPDLTEDLEVRPDQVDGQRAQDFGLAAGTRLSDEIQDAFSQTQAQWSRFERRRLAAGDQLVTVTRSEGEALLQARPVCVSCHASMLPAPRGPRIGPGAERPGWRVARPYASSASTGSGGG